jgi:glycosyltransferase involved in cell wall biosynthesis
MQRLTVAFVCRNFNLRGGQSRIAWELGSRCADDGMDVHFVARRLPPSLKNDEKFTSHRVFQLPRFFGEWNRFRSFARFSSKTADRIVSGNGGVVHGFGDSYQQDIITLGNVDWAYPKYIPGREPDKTAVHVKSVSFRDPHLHYLVLVSKQMKKDILDYFPDFDETKIKIIYPGIDTERFIKFDRSSSRKFVSDKFGVPNEKRWILFGAGGDFEKRNINSVIQALLGMLDNPTWQLIVLGNDRNFPPLPRELAKRVHRLGHVNDVSTILPAFDLLVYPAWYDESPLMVAESMASGVPIIASKTVGVTEVFSPESRREGVLENPGDVDGLRKRISLFVNNQALREKIGEENKKAIQINSWKHIYQQYQEIYYEVSNRKTKGVSRVGSN